MERVGVAGSGPASIAPPADRLGDRSVGRGTDGVPVETFAVCRDLSARAEFCAAVAAARAAADRPARGVSRLVGLHAPSGRDARLLLHQEWLAGERLADVAARRHRDRRPFTIGHVLFVLREAAAALRALHARSAGACHGAISAHRLLVTADDRLVVCEHVLGPGLAALGATRAEWLAEVAGLVVPDVPGVPLFTPLTDQLQLARTALELFTGEPAASSAAALREQVGAVAVVTADGETRPIDESLRALLERALLVSPEGPFRSMTALERAVDALIAAHEGWQPGPPPVIATDPPPEAPAPAAAVPMPVVATMLEGAPAVSAGPLAAVACEPVAVPAPPLRLVTQAHEVAGPDNDRPFGSGALSGPLPAPVEPFTAEPIVATPWPAPQASVDHGLVAAAAPALRVHTPPSPPPMLDDEVFGEAAIRLPVPERVVSLPPPPRRAWWRALAIPAVALCGVSVLAAGLYWLWPLFGSAGTPTPGWLRLESKPVGATVVVNGEAKGQTPLTLSVPAGAYSVEFSLGSERRALTVPVTAHGEAYQLVSLYPPGPPGTIVVSSVPAGAAVTLNGQPRGRTPVELREVAPGEHSLRVDGDVAHVDQVVEVLAGARVEIDVPLSGTIVVEAPFEVSVTEGSTQLGRVSRGSLAVGTGLRRLTFANGSLNYDETREVEVVAGRATVVALKPPTGVINLEADTTAQVFLDGRPLGLTPLTNIPVALGQHEVLFRDARGGEVRYVIVVAVGPAYRLKATLQTSTAARRPARR